MDWKESGRSENIAACRDVAATTSVARQQILNNATRAVFSALSVPRCYKRDREETTSLVWNGRELVARMRSVKGAAIQRGLEHGSKEITIVTSRYQETISEDTAGRKRLSLCSSEL
jgi:hypothetical protein